MAQKQQRATVQVYEAIQPFAFRGVVVPLGATVAAGHEMLKGRGILFRPFQPTFGTLPTEDPAPAPAPAADPDPAPEGGEA